MELYLEIGAVCSIIILWVIWKQRKYSNLSPEQKIEYQNRREKLKERRNLEIRVALLEQEVARKERKIGVINSQLICPHCQSKGKVRTLAVKRKKGISGGKATGALITGGLSIFVTGLSRKEATTQAHCDNCNSTWDF